MRSKLFGRLMSFTLSATVALTSGIPALAYDGGGGDLPEEELEILDLEEEEGLGSDFDASEFEEEVLDEIDVEDSAELLTAESTTLTVTYSGITPSPSVSPYQWEFENDGTNAVTTNLDTVFAQNYYTMTSYSITTGSHYGYSIIDSTLKFNPQESDATVLDDLAITATATPKTYTITFNVAANGGEGTTTTSDGTFDITNPTFAFPATAPTKANMVFDGWYTTASGAGTKVSSTTFPTELIPLDSTSITLFARFASDTPAPDGIDKNMAIKYNNAAWSTFSTVETPSYTYGDATGADVTFTAVADSNDYSKVSWKVYKLNENIAMGATYNNTVYGSGGRWNNSNLTQITDLSTLSSEYGLSFVTSNEGKTFTLHNNGPKKALATTPLVIEIVDSENPLNICRREIRLSIGNGTISPSPTSVNFNAGIATPIKMGYEVADPAEDITSYKTPVVKAKNITLTTSILKEYELNDMEFVWIGADADAFDAVIEKNNTLYVNAPETITIMPKKGLSNKGDKAGMDGSAGWDGTEAGKVIASGLGNPAYADGTYTATLYVKSKAYQTSFKIATVTFAVGNNLAITGAVAHGGEEVEFADYYAVTLTESTNLNVGGYYTRTGNGTEGDPYVYTEASGTVSSGTYYIKMADLGEIHIGESFRDMVITAKGGSGKISFVTNTDRVTQFDTLGLVGTATESADEATFRISGKAQNNATVNTYYFVLQAKDDDENVSPITAYKYKVVNADVTLSLAGEALKYGQANTFEWHAPKGYTAANEAKTLAITNKSEDAVVVTTSWSGGTSDFTLTPAVGDVTIGSGETKNITITPKASASGSTVNSTDTLTISPKSSTTSFAATSIGLIFKENATDFDITKPSSTATITDAYVGEAYAYQFGVTKSSTVTGVTWSVKNVQDGSAKPVVNTSEGIAAFMDKYGLSLNKNSGALTGIPKQVSPAGNLTITVTGKATPSGTTVDRQVTLAIKASTKTFKHSVNGVEATAKNKIDLGKFSLDQLDTLSQTFTVTNASKLDIATAVTTITSVTSSNASTALTGSAFELVFDENSANTNNLLKAGYEIATGESRDIKFKFKNPTSWAVNNAGKYEATVTTTDSASGAFNTFVLKFELVKAPLVSYTSQTFTVGTEVKVTASTGKYAVKLADGGSDVASTFNFEWVKGSIPGLSVSPAGVVYGKPTQAGTFDVTVKATKKTDSSVTALFKHTITVTASSTISIIASDFGLAANTAIPTGKALLLKGAIVGDAAATKGTINLNASTENAENVVITVEDAPDNRTAGAAAAADNVDANIAKYPDNPYKGSSNYIGVDKTTFANIRTSGTENFSIVTKGSPAPGVYKVKITIKGTNTNELVIYAMMVVVDKLAITKPSDFTTSIGTTIAAGKLNIAAVGGAYSQTIEWGEEGTKVTSGTTEKTEFYVTTSGADNTQSAKTGLTLSHEATAVGVTGKTAAASGLINDIQGTMKVAGTYDVNLKASIAAATYDSSVNFTSVATATPDMNADQIIKLSNTDIFNGSLAGVYPKQEGAKATFKIVSTKSNDINITGVTTGTDYGTIQGLQNGNTQVGFDGFTWDGVVSTYSNTAIPVVVQVSNSNTVIDMTAKATVKTTNFEVVAPATVNIVKALNSSTPTDATFTVRPKAGLAKGTYTDTLTISGDDFESVNFTLSLTVEDNTYLTTIDDGNPDLEKRIVYAKDNVKTGKVVEITNYVAGNPAQSASLTIRNTGNTQISNVNAYEVKADGSKYPEASTETMLSIGVLPTIIAEKDTKTLSVTAKKTTAGVYSTYVDVHFTEGTGASAVEQNVIIPVTYTVFDKDLETIEFAQTGDIEMSATEGYVPSSVAVNVTIKNTATAASSVFTGYTVVMNSTGAAVGTNFSIATKAEKTDVAAGGSIVYTVVPNKGLEEGTYSDVITVSGGNLKTAVTKNVTFEVGASTSYTVKATSVAEAYTVIGATTATGLYNSLVNGLAERTTNENPTVTPAGSISTGATVALVSPSSTDTHAVTIDFDDDSNVDVTIVFCGQDDSGKLKNIIGATVVNNGVTVGSKSVTLTATDIAKAKGTGTTARKYYSTINFSFLGKVIFGTPETAHGNQNAIDIDQAKLDANISGGTPFNGTVYAENKADIENDNVVVQYYRTLDKSKKAFGEIYAYVPFGSSLGSVFTSGKLPTAVEAKKAMNGWMSGTDVVAASKIVYSNMTLTPAFHTHTYAPAAETNEKYVKWIWTKDTKGNLSAELHLYCTDENCPDVTASEIVVNDKSKVDGTIINDADGAAGNGNQPLKYDTPKKAPADCEHGAGYKYPATAKVYGTSYTGYYIENEVGEPLGHLYDLTMDPDITWTDKNEDGLMTIDEVKVTRTCSRDAAHVKELTVVSIGEENKVAPTCTKAGSVVYTITYTDITSTGATASNVTKKYNNGTAIVLKAKGHSKVLLAEVTDFNESTRVAKKLTLTCPDCNEVLFEKENVEFTEDASTGTYTYKALLITGDEYDVSYTNHAHVWEGEWSWASDNSKATLTITCKQGAKPEVKTFTVDSTVTKKGAMYTYTVSYTYTWTEKGEKKTKTFEDSKQIVKSDDGQVVEDIVPIDEVLGIYIEGLEEEYKYTGAAIKPVFNVIDASTGLTYLVPGVDYTASYKNNKKIGSVATITIKGKGNYSGQTTSATFTIVDPKKGVEEDDVANLKGVKVILPKDVVYTYDGEAKYPEKFSLKVGKTVTEYTTTDGENYYDASGKALEAVVTFSNNVNAGTARMLLSGKNNAKGVATTTGANFKIAAAPLNETDFAVTVDPTETQWAVKGATPSVELTWKGEALLAGRDFTVKYAKNTKLGTATVTVKGKGNFLAKTSIEKTFTVKAFDLENAVIASATAAAGKAAKSVKVTVLDEYGNAIPAGKLAVAVYDGETLYTGKLVAEKEYSIVATPKNAKVAELTGATPAFTVKVGSDFSKASIKLTNKKYAAEYTGDPITFTDDEFNAIFTSSIKVNKVAKTLKAGEDFEIVGYTNNIKKGTMTITLKGNEDAGLTGTKTVKVKIAPKPIKK
ncbi:InlB B-repeat-containing protein [Butyrivibrio sp. AE3009]|uniref:InlB B-repeat-containing protein n=1 Tax=Butyrivibrio sp. AE3009 TaxID=1280666 RepID=UPI0003B721A5|nr:InlB B-repeat-containing protein [Butyrivibrio sp. AE3009]